MARDAICELENIAFINGSLGDMRRRFQFKLATLLVLVAFPAFAVQLAILAWLSYREIVMQLAQAALIFALFGLLWFAPFLPAILKRRRHR